MTINGDSTAAAVGLHKVYIGSASAEFLMAVFGPDGVSVLEISESGGVGRAEGIFYDVGMLTNDRQRLDFMTALEALADRRRAEAGATESHTNAARRTTPVPIWRADVERLLAEAKAPPRTVAKAATRDPVKAESVAEVPATPTGWMSLCLNVNSSG